MPRPWIKLSATTFKTILTIHIIVSVALIGDSAGYLAIAISAPSDADSVVDKVPYQILNMLAFVFGIPLSFGALLSGLVLSFSTKWGLFRYAWVIAKFMLILSVVFVGALVLKGGMEAMIEGAGGAKGRLIIGSAYDVIALILATFLGVFKPGKRLVF